MSRGLECTKAFSMAALSMAAVTTTLAGTVYMGLAGAEVKAVGAGFLSTLVSGKCLVASFSYSGKYKAVGSELAGAFTGIMGGGALILSLINHFGPQQIVSLDESCSVEEAEIINNKVSVDCSVLVKDVSP